MPESDHQPSEAQSLALRSLKRVLLSKVFLAVVLVILIAIGSISVYFFYPIRATNISRVAENRAAIVDALSAQRPDPAFEENTVRYLTSAGLSVDVYSASQVTVEFMKSFPVGYVLVIFRVHSGTSGHGVFYFTSELYDNQVERNSVVKNNADGILVDEQSAENKITGNIVTGNGDGATSFDLHDEGSDNVWLSNMFNTKIPDTIG